MLQLDAFLAFHGNTFNSVLRGSFIFLGSGINQKICWKRERWKNDPRRRLHAQIDTDFLSDQARTFVLLLLLPIE